MGTFSGKNFRWIENVRHLQLNDTHGRFEANNPIILPGEIALVTDKRKIKIGTGARYSETRYIAGTDPVHADTLSSLPTVDLATLKITSGLPSNSVIIEDFLTIEDYVISPKVLSSSVVLKRTITDKSNAIYNLNNLSDWIDKVDDLGIISSEALRIGNNTSNQAFVTINSMNSAKKIEGYKRPAMYLIDDNTSDGTAFSFCVRDAITDTNKPVMVIHNNGRITDCVVEKAATIGPITLKLTGAVSGSVEFDGSSDTTIPVTAKDVAPKNLIFKNITLAPILFNDKNQFIFSNELIKSTHVPNLYISRDTLPYAEDAGVTVYTTNGTMVIECSELPTSNIVIETAILIPT